MHSRIALTLTLTLTGCGDASIPACPDGGTTLTYENFGQAFLDTNCNWCHAQSVTDRRGAPYDFTFDTIGQVKAHRDRIYLRSTGDRPSMPPGPTKPSSTERARLSEWLTCLPP